MRRELVSIGILLFILGLTAFFQDSNIERYYPCHEGHTITAIMEPRSIFSSSFGIADSKTIVELDITTDQRAVVRIKSGERSVYKRTFSPGSHSWNITLRNSEGRYRLMITNPHKTPLSIRLNIRFYVLMTEEIRPYRDASRPVISAGLIALLLGILLPSPSTDVSSRVLAFLGATSLLHLIGFIYEVPLFFFSSLITFLFAISLSTSLLARSICTSHRNVRRRVLPIFLISCLIIQIMISILLLPLYLGKTGLVMEKEVGSEMRRLNPDLGLCDHLERGTTEETIRNHFKLLRSSGASWVRLDMSWEDIEPKRGVWRFQLWDSIIRISSHYGIRVLPILSRTPRWASSRPESDLYHSYPPREIGDFGDFVKRVVERYGRKIYFWEIWNEPDAQFLRATAEDYARLLREAESALAVADPTGNIVLGGISSSGHSFLEELIRIGATDSIDIIGLHLYGRDASEIMGRLKSFLDILETSELNNPVWVTEIGQPASIPYAAEEKQAAFLKKTFTALSSTERIKKIFWYELKDNGLNPLLPEQNFGLVRYDLTPKISYITYFKLAENLRFSSSSEI